MQTHGIQRQTHPVISASGHQAPGATYYSHIYLLAAWEDALSTVQATFCFLLLLGISFSIFFSTFPNPFFSSLLSKRKSHCQSDSTEAFEAPRTYIHPAEASSQSPKMTYLPSAKGHVLQRVIKSMKFEGTQGWAQNLTLLLTALYPGGNELTSASQFLICKMSLIPIFKRMGK